MLLSKGIFNIVKFAYSVLLLMGCTHKLASALWNGSHFVFDFQHYLIITCKISIFLLKFALKLDSLSLIFLTVLVLYFYFCFFSPFFLVTLLGVCRICFSC